MKSYDKVDPKEAWRDMKEIFPSGNLDICCIFLHEEQKFHEKQEKASNGKVANILRRGDK